MSVTRSTSSPLRAAEAFTSQMPGNFEAINLFQFGDRQKEWPYRFVQCVFEAAGDASLGRPVARLEYARP